MIHRMIGCSDVFSDGSLLDCSLSSPRTPYSLKAGSCQKSINPAASSRKGSKNSLDPVEDDIEGKS